MSRSRGERSVPNMRGRKQEMKTKRLSHKRARKLPLDSSSFELNIISKSIKLDRETKQSDIGK